MSNRKTFLPPDNRKYEKDKTAPSLFNLLEVERDGMKVVIGTEPYGEDTQKWLFRIFNPGKAKEPTQQMAIIGVSFEIDGKIIPAGVYKNGKRTHDLYGNEIKE